MRSALRAAGSMEHRAWGMEIQARKAGKARKGFSGDG